VLSRLKADRSTRHIPVIMISALDELDSTVRCIEAGAEDYLPKPFNPILLRARIGACLQKKRLLDELHAEKERSETLLLNILPRTIVERMRRGETVIADRVAAATILFADLVDFTSLADRLSPEETVALLGDTLHNAADALTAVPLGIAFLLGRRPPTRRYTYGYGRAEDLAGVAIVLIIAGSSALAGYAAVSRLAHPRPVSDLIAVAGAAVIGFIGNEAVARYRVRTGRRIGSAALVADGLHARADGFTSLAVLLGAGGVAAGWDWADPVVGLLITGAILLVLWQAAREIYRRLMDAVDPAVVDQVERTLRGTPGVLGVGQVRVRWIGHNLRAECEVIVDPGGTVIQAHQVAVNAEHALLHALPRLTAALVHADPGRTGDTDHHAILTAHR